MLNSIFLDGFKSFVNDEIEFGGLTLLTGLNSSGKSSVIQSLLLLEKASKGDDIYLPGHGEISESQNPYVLDGVLIFGTFSDGEVIEISNDEVVQNTVIDFPEIIHIGADRFGPETSIAIDNMSKKIGRKGENIFKIIEDCGDDLMNEKLRHEKSQGDTFEFNLEGWLNIISPNSNFKSFIEKKIDSSYGTFNGHRAKNVGFGLSYTLPVITALLLGSLKENAIVIIENPEAHLHPRGQTELARLICLCAEVGVQVIIETHSDHLFDGIRYYIKSSQTEFHRRVISYWFELDKNNNTQVEQIRIDINGRVGNWPAGMFDQFSINASKLL